jgi:hypothetical protein
MFLSDALQFLFSFPYQLLGSCDSVPLLVIFMDSNYADWAATHEYSE